MKLKGLSIYCMTQVSRTLHATFNTREYSQYDYYKYLLDKATSTIMPFNQSVVNKFIYCAVPVLELRHACSAAYRCEPL